MCLLKVAYRRKCMKQLNHGFSLVEVMIVVVLIGILSVAAVPTMVMPQKQQVKEINQNFLHDLLAVRQKAVMQAGENVYTFQLIGDGTNDYGYCFFVTPEGESRAIYKKQEQYSREVQIKMEKEKDATLTPVVFPIQIDENGCLYDADTQEANRKINKLRLTTTFKKIKQEMIFYGETGYYEVGEAK